MKTIRQRWNAVKGSRFFQTFKEEMLTIPVVMLLFFAINYGLSAAFPNSAFFDFASQSETLAFRVVSFVTVLAIAWFGLRIAMPPVFRFLIDDFYHKFDEIPAKEKRQWAVIIFLVFLLSVALVSRAGAITPGTETRTKLTAKLHTQLMVRETTPNQGPEVSQYLRSVGVTTPAPWCAAFVSWNLQQFAVPNPMSAWSPDYAKQQDIIWTAKRPTRWKPLPGDVATYYYPKLHRVGHVGFFICTDPDGYFVTIEGNTNGAGSREGDGVYKKKRNPSQVHAITRYIKE